MKIFYLTLCASTETQNFVRPHVSTFLSKYWRYCFDKHTNEHRDNFTYSWHYSEFHG